MAEFTYIELRSARESQKMTRWKLAEAIGVSEDTLGRWEKGEQQPHPDDIGNIERALGVRDMWHRWMMSNIDSYRERFGEINRTGHITAAFVQAECEIKDVVPLLTVAIRDTLDGKIDDPQACKVLRKEMLEAMAAIQQALEYMPEDE